MKIKKAVIPAAGLGTRFLPATKAMPKEMLPIVDKPTIQYIVEEIVAAGIEEILIITSHTKKAVEDHFDKSYELERELFDHGKTDLYQMARDIANIADIHFIRQKEQKGLGHAVQYAKTFVGNEPFAVLLGDDIVDGTPPCLKQMVEKFEQYHGTILGVQTVPHENVYKYGIVSGEKISDRIYQVSNLIEKPPVDEAPTDLAVLGRYIITPAIFELLETTKPGAGGEIQLTDALCRLAQQEAVYAYDFIGRRYDVGDKMGFLEATVDFALKRDDLRDGFLSYLKTKTEQEL